MNIYNSLGYTRRKYLQPINGELRTFGVRSPGHTGPFTNAVDLIVPNPEIEPIDIFAPSEGKIVYLKQDSTIWGPSATFRNYTNFVTAQTKWGEFWEIAHIAANSCKYSLGDTIKAGAYVASTGLNGWTTVTDDTPDSHVHLLVGIWLPRSTWGFKSLKIRFAQKETV